MTEKEESAKVKKDKRGTELVRKDLVEEARKKEILRKRFGRNQLSCAG